MTERLFDDMSDPALRKQAREDTGQYLARLVLRPLPEQLDQRRSTADALSNVTDDEVLKMYLKGEI